MQCVIVGGAQGNHPRGAFFVPDPDECEGSGGGAVTIGNGIRDGINYTCELNAGSSCDDTTCVNDFTGNMQGRDIRGFNERMNRTNPPDGRTLCPDSTNGPNTFRAAFTYAGGGAIPSNRQPAGLNTPVNVVNGTADPVNTVYEPKACWSPRVVLLVVTDNGTRVRGFAAVFITGCFEERAGQPGNALTNTINRCGAANQYGGHTEVRAVLLRVFVTSDSVGGIGPVTTTSPLTIQTTK
jgi:hypothetical protein